MAQGSTSISFWYLPIKQIYYYSLFMTCPIVDPLIPFVGVIPGGLQPGKMLRLQGVIHPNADRFHVNFYTGPEHYPEDLNALHISVRFNEGRIIRNSYENGKWGSEEKSGGMPIGKSQAFEILILVDKQNYKIAVNGKHFSDYSHRIPVEKVSHLLIDSDVSITLISWESIVGVGVAVNESTSKVSSVLNIESPPARSYGPPGVNYAPPGQNKQPALGNCGYGEPPSRGEQAETGFDIYLDQVQIDLAAAIKRGSAKKLLDSFLVSGNPQKSRGYALQNAQYGHYPQPKSNQESVLSSCLNQLQSNQKSVMSGYLDQPQSNQEEEAAIPGAQGPLDKITV